MWKTTNGGFSCPSPGLCPLIREGFRYYPYVPLPPLLFLVGLVGAMLYGVWEWFVSLILLGLVVHDGARKGFECWCCACITVLKAHSTGSGRLKHGSFLVIDEGEGGGAGSMPDRVCWFVLGPFSNMTELYSVGRFVRAVRGIQ